MAREARTSHATHSGRAWADALNALLMLGVIVPPALLTAQLRRICPALGLAAAARGTWAEMLERVLRQLWHERGLSEGLVCEIYLGQPLLLVNLLYFAVVDVGFYLIYLLQGSTWLIDPHWQLIPMSIAAFWFVHPDASSGDAVRPRAIIALGLVYLWGFRLLHNCERQARLHVAERALLPELLLIVIQNNYRHLYTAACICVARLNCTCCPQI